MRKSIVRSLSLVVAIAATGAAQESTSPRAGFHSRHRTPPRDFGPLAGEP